MVIHVEEVPRRNREDFGQSKIEVVDLIVQDLKEVRIRIEDLARPRKAQCNVEDVVDKAAYAGDGVLVIESVGSQYLKKMGETDWGIRLVAFSTVVYRLERQAEVLTRRLLESAHGPCGC